MQTRPYSGAVLEAYAVPHDMEVLTSVFDMFNNDPLVMEFLISVFFFQTFNYC